MPIAQNHTTVEHDMSDTTKIGALRVQARAAKFPPVYVMMGNNNTGEEINQQNQE
jgi:hypothetical protein